MTPVLAGAVFSTLPLDASLLLVPSELLQLIVGALDTRLPLQMTCPGKSFEFEEIEG
jgi:hypothetical protein